MMDDTKPVKAPAKKAAPAKAAAPVKKAVPAAPADDVVATPEQAAPAVDTVPVPEPEPAVAVAQDTPTHAGAGSYGRAATSRIPPVARRHR